MRSRACIPMVALSATLLFLLGTPGAHADGTRQAVTVVTSGTVVWSEAPFQIGLDSGWTVDLSQATIGEGCDLSTGSKIEVIGLTEPGVRPGLLHAGHVRGAGLREAPEATAGRLVKSDDDEDITVEGLVTAVHEQSFELEASPTIYLVEVDGDTELSGFDSLGELAVGDGVEVRGLLSGSTITATRVKLLDGDDDGDDGDGGGDDDDGIEFEHHGQLLELQPPRAFRMDDGLIYEVDELTDYDDELVSYSGLAVGQVLEVKALRLPGGVNRVTQIELEDDGGSGGPVEVEGEVVAVSADELVLDSVGAILLVPSTEYNGDADSWTEIEPGWSAEVTALPTAGGSLTATTVRAENPEPSSVDGEDFEPHQALVVIRAGADPAALASRYAAVLVGEITDLAVLLWWPEEIDNALLASLAADAEVLAVEPNYFFRDPESVRRRYPIVDRSADPEKFYNQPAAQQVRLNTALWRATGRGSVVAVIDTGVDPQHPVLDLRILTGGLDLVDGDAQPWETRNGNDDDGDGDVDEAAGHGTFVASIVALAAPAAQILPYRVLDDDGGGTAYHLALALADAIDRGAHVICLSLVYRQRSSAVDLLLEQASARGVVVVASAGNDGTSAIPFPAADSHVIGVTALDQQAAALADFANRSPLLTLAAPGESVYGALDEQQFGTSSGTSMAAPWVAAAAAILHEIAPGLAPPLVEAALEQSGTQLAETSWQGVRLHMGNVVQLVGGQTEALVPPQSTAFD